MLRANQIDPRQRGLKHLKKAIFLAKDCLARLELLFQTQSGLRISETENTLAVQQFDQVKLNLLVLNHRSYMDGPK